MCWNDMMADVIVSITIASIGGKMFASIPGSGCPGSFLWIRSIPMVNIFEALSVQTAPGLTDPSPNTSKNTESPRLQSTPLRTPASIPVAISRVGSWEAKPAFLDRARSGSYNGNVCVGTTRTRAAPDGLERLS